MFRVVFFLLPKFGLVAIVICAINSNDAFSQTRYSSIAKCSQLQFAKPNSPELSKCPDCSVDAKGVLTCNCFTDAPESTELRESSLSIYSCPRNYAYPRCAEHIRVVNGELQCRRIPEESTFQNQCWSCASEGSLLKCDCWYKDRKHLTTELEMKDCHEPISSCDGVLTCGLCATEEPRELNWIAPVLFSIGVSVPFVFMVRYVWIKFIRS